MRSLFIFILIILPLSVLEAQVIDTSELNKLQSGQYKLAEGQLQVLFKDTTTLSFAQQEMNSLGLEIKTTEFENVVMTIERYPSEDDIQSLQKNEKVKMVINEASFLKSEIGKAKSISDFTFHNVDADKVSDFKFMDRYQFVFVVLKDKATIKDANQIIEQYPNLKLNVLSEARRAAVVLTRSKNEDEIITILESKPYIESVAYMGVIE